MIHSTLLLLSNILVIFAYALYIIGILQGKAKPHRTTRFVLLIITALATASLFAQHNYTALWLAGLSAFMSLIIFLLTIRKGMGGWSRLDIICLIIALLGIASWKITNNAFIALCSAILADFTGCIPSLIKTYKYPHTEVWTFFTFATISSALNLAASTSWTFQEIAYSLYLTIIGGALSLIHI